MWNVHVISSTRETIAVGAFSDWNDAKAFAKRHSYAQEIHFEKVKCDSMFGGL